jgi:hypothetical protein
MEGNEQTASDLAAVRLLVKRLRTRRRRINAINVFPILGFDSDGHPELAEKLDDEGIAA